jgi:hypothetical protein
MSFHLIFRKTPPCQPDSWERIMGDIGLFGFPDVRGYLYFGFSDLGHGS